MLLVVRGNFRIVSMSPLLASGCNITLPYRMSATNNLFERLEKSLGGNVVLRPLRS